MTAKNRRLVIFLICFYIAACFCLRYHRPVHFIPPPQDPDLYLVRSGRPEATIVIPAQSLPVESYAAKELLYHIQAATGVKLSIVTEDKALPSGTRIYLGHCKAAIEAGVDPNGLAGDGYILRQVGQSYFIVGKDTAGDPLSRDTHVGTLLGVYDQLEKNLGVQWLWPGKLGEVIPKCNSLPLQVPAILAYNPPALWFKEWQGGLLNPSQSVSDPKHRSFAREQAIWMRRQQFGWSYMSGYGHPFGAYWSRFSQTHPEYFNRMPDGKRGPDPTGAKIRPVAERVHLCVSQPALWDRIIDEWRVKGMPEFLNVCENDGYAACSCPQCLAWDEPDPDLKVPFDKRFEAAKRAFDARDDSWMLQMGSLSDRYAKFWKAVSEKAVIFNPNVKVVTYVCDNYRKPSVKPIHLSPNVLCGIVTLVPFPYDKQASQQFQKECKEWSKTGCRLFLKPDFTLYGHNYPLPYARNLGKDLTMDLPVYGMDFDGLTGQYATQGPTLYMLARIRNHPEASVEGAFNEYCAAFGPARRTILEYFNYWEKVNQRYSAEEMEQMRRAKRKYGSRLELIMGPEIFTPDAMRRGWALLEQARKQAVGDPMASARVEWLELGLQQVDLVLATERAYEHGVDTGDRTPFQKAHQALIDFRVQHEDSLISDFDFLTADEDSQWKAQLQSRN